MKDFRPQYIETGVARRYPRTLADAFPDAVWRAGIVHYRRPAHSLGLGRLLVVFGLCLLLCGAFVK